MASKAAAPAAAHLPSLELAVQYATRSTPLPTRAQVRRWMREALASNALITLRIVDDAEGRQLNRQYRRKDYATNVLTFVYDAAEPNDIFGDIVLCAATVKREAKEQKKSPLAHYAHLIVHGVLHLQGYDHERSREAKVMEGLETFILRRLGFADPYAVSG